MAVIKADGQIDYDYDSLEKQFPDAEIGTRIDAYFKEAIGEIGLKISSKMLWK